MRNVYLLTTFRIHEGNSAGANHKCMTRNHFHYEQYRKALTNLFFRT